MKTKGILTFAFCLCVSFVFGQEIFAPTTSVGASSNTGVGIFTNTPTGKFHLKGNLNDVANFDATVTQFGTEASLNRARFEFAAANDVALFDLTSDYTNFPDFGFRFLRDGSGNTVMQHKGTGSLSINTIEAAPIGFATTSTVRMSITAAGNVGIGTTNPNSLLSVNGKVESEEIQVIADVADYVFEEDYKLMSLEALESYINENGYLPNIQNRSDVEKNRGLVKIGELSISLMEKMEELTLHLIDLNKKVKNLENVNKNLKTKIKEMEKE